jgi:hypothetical protein
VDRETSPGTSPSRPAPARGRGAHAVLLCVMVVLTFYARSAWSYGKSLDPAPTRATFQNDIADAFLAGQLNLTIPTPKGLLQLRDPYDPVANQQYRAQGLHDLSLYKGKLYAYFGPAPAILLYIPYRALHVGQLSPTLAALIFCSVGFLFALLLFRLLVRWCCGDVPTWVHCVAVFALGFGVPAGWIVYIGRDYEVSIACAYMLLFAGLYLLARGVLGDWSPAMLALGSGALAFAVAARPTMLPAGLFVLLALVLLAGRGLPAPARNLRLAALIGPYALIGVLLALYNFARFDSIFEFGSSYQLAGLNSTIYPFGRVSRIPKGLYYYLLAPGRILRTFPYLFLRKTMPYPLQSATYTKYTNEPVAGAITDMPAAAAGYLLVAAGVGRVTRAFRRLLPTLAVLVVPAVLVLVLISFTINGATMRYELDYVPLIVMGSTLAWAVWSQAPGRRPWVTWSGNLLWLVALAGSMAFNVATTLTPCAGKGSC